MPKKKTVNNYFSQEVEDSIHLFNKSSNDLERNKLFKAIYPALCKLAEVWRNKIKPAYVELPPEELEMDCVTFLLEKIPMVKEGKGKAFSYLTVTARNYYIQANMKAYAKRLKGYSLEAMPESFDIEDIPSDRVDEMEWNGSLFDSFMEYMEDNFENMFDAKKQKIFGTSLINKIKSLDLNDELNRRKILNEIAEETGLPRNIITKQINRVAAFFSTFRNYYEKYGVKPKFKEKMHITEEDAEYIRKNYEHYSKHNGLSGISRRLGINYTIVRDWVRTTL